METESAATIRDRVRAWRRGLDATTRSCAATDLAELGAGWGLLASVRYFGSYVAVDGELDPAPLAAHLEATGAVPHLPVLEGDRLAFARDDPATPRRANRFGIPEPIGPAVAWADLDLVLVPLVAVDRVGNRLGFGAGFYDRTFADLIERSRPARPLLLGLAYDVQVVGALTARPWDVPLDAVLTPTQRLGITVPPG